jgi:hypothetical protein
MGHSLVLRELIDAVGKREDPKVGGHAHANAPVQGRKHIYADMAKLFLQDLVNVEAGFYPIPRITTDLS